MTKTVTSLRTGDSVMTYRGIGTVVCIHRRETCSAIWVRTNDGGAVHVIIDNDGSVKTGEANRVSPK